MDSGENCAKLIVSIEGQAGKIVALDNLLTIGRSIGCQVVLDDHEASRNHAEIRLIGGRYRLSDLGSANGTWVNGRRLTVPKDLEDGDEIQIGRVKIQYQAPLEAAADDSSMTPSTKFAMRTEHVVVLVADIRNYTGMSEALPSAEFSQLVSTWFREGSQIIEQHGGIIDKFIGDAIMAFWITSSKSDHSKEVNLALQTVTELVARAHVFSTRLNTEFPEYKFRIGIALNCGDAILGNVGTGENQAFTIVGDSVNVAFRLEALTKEENAPVIVGRGIVEAAGKEYQFSDLGEVQVKGRKEPVPIWSLNLGAEG
jgi:adenylate cyclase